MNPAPNLVLVGPMGSGKSSIGKRIAQRLALQFVDLDARLEEVAGARVATLFELEGEAAFRRREQQLLEEVLRSEDQVVATGGGAVLSASSRERVSERGFVVYLKIDIPQQLHRLARDTQRPLLAGGDRRAKLESLAAVRNPLYESVADLSFESGGLPVGSAAARLCALVQAQWQRGAAT